MGDGVILALETLFPKLSLSAGDDLIIAQSIIPLHKLWHKSQSNIIIGTSSSN
jgi:hypothetical protein